MMSGQSSLRRPLWSGFIAAAILLATAGASTASAALLVYIDKSAQRMDVVVDGIRRFSWPVSTGRGGYGTPSGVYHPQMLARSWFSRRYYNSPMPYSIFFHRGYAIHGTYELSRLGGPASHGCVRLHPYNAAILFSLVREEGLRSTRIVVE
jgi:lipoprotein-anchoring transpeptidase ErfK/SrfK